MSVASDNRTVEELLALRRRLMALRDGEFKERWAKRSQEEIDRVDQRLLELGYFQEADTAISEKA